MSVAINEFAKKAYKKFISSGMTQEGACGMLGNIYAESGMIANRVEILCLKRIKEYYGITYTDETYTAAVDSGEISRAQFLNPIPGKQYGFSAIQLTSPSRKAGLYDRTVAKGKSIGDEDEQLEYIIYELKNSYQGVWNVLKTSHSLKECSDKVLKDFEIPANWIQYSQLRYSYSLEYYNYFKNQKVETTSTKSTQSTQSQKGATAMTKSEKATQWMEALAHDDSHGYDQAFRWGEKGDYDCSSAVINAWEKAGVPVKSNGATYTGNMYQVFIKCGFKDVTASVNLSTGAGLKRSDVLLNHVHHVAMYCGNGQEVEASINEWGGATGGQPGDQTGREILIRSYRNYPWNAVLRYPEEASSSSSASGGSSSGNSTKTIWVGKVNKASAPVRKWAGSEYDEVSFSPLKKGTKVEVQYSIKDNSHEDWYFVKVGDKYGFIYYKWVTKTSTKISTKTSTKTTTTSTSGKTQFRVQAGAYSVESNAKTVVKTLKKSGYDGVVIHSGNIYIAQVGMFESLNNANRLRDQLKADGFDAAVIAVK